MAKPVPSGNPPPSGIVDFRSRLKKVSDTPRTPAPTTPPRTDPAAEQMAKMTYTRTSKEVAPKLLAVRAVVPLPPPLTAALAKVNEEETKRAAVGDIPAPKYVEAVAAVAKLEEEIEAFNTALKKFQTEKAAYDAKYKNLAKRVETVETHADLAPNTPKTAVAAAKPAWADLVKDDVQNFAGAMAPAAALDTKITAFFDAALDADLKKSPPDKVALKKLMDNGGQDKLDSLVKGFAPGANRAAITAAMEVRFGLQLEITETTLTGDVLGDADKKRAATKSLKKVYELMLLVPDTHTKDNDKLKKIQHHDMGTATDTSYYDNRTDEGIVVLKCGRPGAGYVPSSWGKGLPTVETDYQAADAVAPDYFDFTTLHEVGHAIDEKTGFMRGTVGRGHAGWEDFGSDPTKVAEAAARKFRYDSGYVTKLLRCAANGRPPVGDIPGPASGRTQVDWDMARAAVEAWADKVRTGKNPWDSAPGDDVTIGGKMYHESYDGFWVAYSVDARKKGISGYMFRAPGEWFADLYAARYCEKLKPSNPYVAMIDNLAKPPA